MGRTIQERIGVIQNDDKKKRKDKNHENRRIRKLEKHIKEVRRITVRLLNQLRWKVQRKFTKRKKYYSNCKNPQRISKIGIKSYYSLRKRGMRNYDTEK